MPAELNDKLAQLHSRISDHLEEISHYFNGSVKMTLLIRTSDEAEGNVLLSDDDIQTVIDQLTVMKSWPATVKRWSPPVSPDSSLT